MKKPIIPIEVLAKHIVLFYETQNDLLQYQQGNSVILNFVRSIMAMFADWVEYTSEETLKNPDAVVKEHAVPVHAIVTMINKLYKDEKLTVENVQDILNKYLVICMVTKEEDAKMTEIGLQKSMPKDWDGLNVWARYDAVGIKPIKLEKKVYMSKVSMKKIVG